MAHHSTMRTAKAHGRTVSQMKVILVEEGLLGEDGPTERALADGVAVLREINPETAPYAPCGRTHYAAWDKAEIGKIMARRDGGAIRKRVSSAFDLISALERVGSLMTCSRAFDQAVANDLRYSGHAADHGLRALGGDWRGALTDFRDAFAPVRATAARLRGRNAEAGAEIASLLNAAEDFLRRRGAT